MAIAITGQSIFNLTPAATSYTNSFTVPAGTDTLLVIPIMRTALGSGVVASISSITQNGVAMTSGFNNFSSGGFDINTYIAYRRSPSIGAFNIVVNCANVSGGALWCLALSGVAASGNPVGGTNAQRSSSSTATQVGLGLTPASGSLLLTAIASGNNHGTVTGFTGASFLDDGTGRYSPNGDMPATMRHRLNAPATAMTVSATFSEASPNCGGLLAEILADVPASATTDVSGTAAVTVAVAGTTASDTGGTAGGGAAQASIANASFRQLNTWTEIVSLQPDVAGVDRRIISTGVVANPTLTLSQLAPDRNYSWAYRLSDGDVQVDSAPSTQSLTPHHLALVHDGATLRQELYLNGIASGQVVKGDNFSGTLVVATDGERIGAHGAASPEAYSGLIGRYLLYAGAMTAEQVRLLALSEIDPDAFWGVGSEDDAQAANQSVVACPLHTELDGQPSLTIKPTILDPSGGTLAITATTQPANGTLAISDLDLIYRPTRGWQGADSASYTATDGITSSTGQLTFRQTRPALKCTNDAVTCASGGNVTFDPRLNDVGAGALRITSYSGTAHGAVTLNADGTLGYGNVGTDSATSDSFSYTVVDDYSQQSATVSITITTGSFLVANPVSTSTTKDKFVDVNVVAAADVSADLAPAVVKSGSVTAPASGTAALQTSGMIRYTPPTGEDGFSDQFDFTLKPSARATPESTNRVTVNVLTAGTAARPKTPPTTGPVKPVNASNIGNIYANANPGDQLILAAGNYGACNFNRNFPDNNPVIIRSAVGSPWSAIFTGTVTLSGSNHWLYEIKTQQPAISSTQIGISLAKNRQIITRCWINNADGIHAPENLGKNRGYIWLGWNRFTGQNKLDSTRDHIYFTMPSEDGWRSNTDGPHQLYIYRNFFWDSTSVGDKDHSVYFGDTKAGVRDIPMMWEVYLEENFWHLDCKRRRTLYLKRGCNVMYNHSNANQLNWGTRHGRASKWWGNRSANDYMMIPGVRSVQGGGNNTVYPNVVAGGSWPTAADGHHHDIRGNIMTGGGGYRVFTGCTPSATDLEPPFQAAHFAVLVGNAGNYITLGYLNHNFVNEHEGGRVEGAKVYTAGQMPIGSVKKSATREGGSWSPTIISSGDGGYAYPGDGSTRAPANYASNGSEQGVGGNTQASAT